MAREAAEGYWGLAARRCDSCKGSPAVLFRKADAAYLCGTCDSRMHGANRLASRHERLWMCEVCEQGPAAVTCKADAATLCVTCDADIHEANPLARRHERFPVVPFYDPLSSAIRPSATAAASSSGDEDDHESSHAIAAARWMMPNPGTGTNPKVMMEAPDLNFADVDPYLDLDYADGLVSMPGKPVAPPATMIAPNGVVEIDIALGKSSYSSCSATHSLSHSVSLSEVGVIPDSGGGAMADVSNPYGRPAVVAAAANPAAGMNREARVMRYREKRKNRKFEKKIWYASRKAYAEIRPRIKGRFAKRVEMDADVDRISSAAPVAGILVDNGFGVVPSF